MASLIDSGYFEGALGIPNLDKPGTGERVAWFIERYEPVILREILGYELSKSLKDQVADYNPGGSNIIDQKWLNLIEGADYNLHGNVNRPRRYNGLPDIIARYVYWRFVKDKYTQSTPLGEAKAKSENADEANPAEKLVEAWDEMSEMIYELYFFLEQNKETYPEWLKHDRHRVLRHFEKTNLFGF